MGQDTKASFEDILNVITTLTSKTVVHSSTSYNNMTSISQNNVNSTGCKNVAFSSQKNMVYVDTNLFQDQATYQDLMLSIIQNITSTMEQTSHGGRTPQEEALIESIQDKLSTALTSQVLTTITNSINSSSSVEQNCVNSSSGINFSIMKQHNVYRVFNNLYSNNATIQSVAADISNMMSGDQSQKKTGVLVTLMRMIAIVVVAICAVIVIGVIGFIMLTVM
jgi:ABC-type anion transport system duplicated permease subunit